MPFGLDYNGGFASFSDGVLWLIFSFIFFFVFSYLSTRGNKNAVLAALTVTIYAILFNAAFILFELPLIITTVLCLAAYIVIAKYITGMAFRETAKLVLIISINFSITLLIPQMFQWFYAIVVFLYFYLKSEQRLRETKLGY